MSLRPIPPPLSKHTTRRFSAPLPARTPAQPPALPVALLPILARVLARWHWRRLAGRMGPPEASHRGPFAKRHSAD